MKNVNILLVEDDEEDILIIKEILRRSSFSNFVLEIEMRVAEAQRTLASREYDLVLLDYNLGPRNARDLIEGADLRAKLTPFIVLTGIAIEERDAEALQLGASDFIEKSHLAPELLARSIRYALSRAELLREQQRRDQQRIEMLEQQISSQKMAALGSLAGGVAHNFNNILAAILAASELLARRSGEQARPHAETIESLVLRGKGVVADLLNYTRGCDKDESECDAGEVIEEAYRLVRAGMPPSVEMALPNLPENCRVAANSDHLHQVVTNLLINACQAVQEVGTGTVLIAFDSLEMPRQRDQLNRSENQWLMIGNAKETEEVRTGAPNDSLKPRDYQLIRIEDTAGSLDPETVPDILEPFYTSRGLSGTGLGLASVRRNIQQMEGCLTLSIDPGRSTVFEVLIPAAESSDLADNGAGAIAENSGLPERARVCLVDDEEIVGENFSLLLSRHGFEVSYFANPLQALAELEASPEQWDVLLTDENMPELSGLDLAERVHSLRDDLPIILWSGRPLEERDDRLADIGVSRFLMKPIRIREIQEAIEQSIARDGQEASKREASMAH